MFLLFFLIDKKIHINYHAIDFESQYKLCQ